MFAFYFGECVVESDVTKKSFPQPNSDIISWIALCFCTDTRNTQWEDPRLQSPAITGPVSIWLTRQNRRKRNVEAFYTEATSCSMLLRTAVQLELLSFTLSLLSLYTQDESLCQHHSTYQHPCSILCATSDTVSCWRPQMHTAVLTLVSRVRPLFEKSMTCVCGICCLQAVPYSREFKQKYDYFRKKLKKPVRPTFQFFAINTWTTCSSAAFWLIWPFVASRLTFPTDLKWSYTGTTSLKSLTGALCPWRGLTSWRLGCGLSLSLRKDWTMAAWPESGSSSYLKRCSILITAYLNTLPRKLLLIACLRCRDLFTLHVHYRHVLHNWLCKKDIREGCGCFSTLRQQYW